MQVKKKKKKVLYSQPRSVHRWSMNEGAVMKSAGKKAEIQKQKAGQETIRLTDTHTLGKGL